MTEVEAWAKIKRGDAKGFFLVNPKNSEA